MNTTYSNNIRIYASVGGQAKFYDVIGRYAIPGGEANPSGASYAIDLGLYLPVIRTTVTYNNETQFKYYYIPVDSDNSNRIHTASEVPSANQQYVELFIGNLSYPTYSQNTPEDLYLLANNYALDRAVTIYTFSNNTANATWTTYDLTIVEESDTISYLVRENGSTIYDNANLLSQLGEADFSLQETNSDNALIDPSSSTVESLTTFTVTYPNKTISSIASSGHSIKIFNAQTQDVVREIGLPTKMEGFNNKITFSTNIVNLPGSYYLYIPIGTVIFSSGSSARFVKRYTIQAQNAGGDPLAFTATPLAGTTYENINIEFVNVDSIVGWDSTNRIQVDLMNGDTVVSGTNATLTYGGSSGYTCSMLDNVFKISNLHAAISSLGSTYLRDTSNKKVRITIPLDTVRITNNEYSNQIQIYYTLIGTNSSSSSSDNITYSCYPMSGSNIYKLYRIELTFPLTASNQLIIVDLSLDADVVKDEVIIRKFKYEPSETKYIYQGGYRQVQIYFYLYDGNTLDTIEEPGIYNVTFKQGTFIKSDGNDIISTEQFTLSYEIVDFSSDELTDGFNNYYCHGLLRVKGNRGDVGNLLSFRTASDVEGESNTIFINSSLLNSITLFPRLELAETILDSEGKDTGMQKEAPHVYTLLDLDILVMSLSISGENNRVNYKYDYDPKRTLEEENVLLFRYNHEETFVNLLGLTLISELPKKLHIDFVMNFGNSRFKFNTYIQILPSPIYLNYIKKLEQDLVYSIKNNVDLYTGKESEIVCVSSKSTLYDEIICEKFDNDGTEIMLYPAKLDTVTKVRLGNLDGIYDEKQKGKQPYGFGLYGQNVFLTGNFYLNNGRSLVDISDDILLATGNITGIRERLDNLDDEFKDLSTELSTDLRFMRDAMPASISNFISTNKTALFRLGLDTSIWALGSAGITLYNPNVSYVPDNKTGKMVVDENTVGDFDESILMQADNIRINNYVKAIIGNDVYYKVLVCDVNPKSWIYTKDGNGKMIVSTNPKYEYNNNTYYIGGGNLKYAWVKLSQITNMNNSVGLNAIRMGNTFNCETILRYIKIDDSGEEIVVVSPNADGLIYSFSNYYYKLNGLYYANPGDSNYTAIFNSETYFVPVVVLAALFDNGIINARYIKVENITAENILAISSDYLLNNRVGAIYNDAFDISKEISELNYPIIKLVDLDEGGNPIYLNDYYAPFVVISGTTGAITATSADISGSITIGNKYSDDSTYLKLYKGDGNSAPGMYIYRKENDVFNEVASFGGWVNSNPLSRFKSGGNGSITSSNTITVPYSNQTISITALTEPDLLPNQHVSPQLSISYGEPIVMGYASASDTRNYTSSSTLSIPSTGSPIYLTGTLEFNAFPSFNHSGVQRCYANAYASTMVYLLKHGTSERVALRGYSMTFSKSYNTYTQLYSHSVSSSGLNNMTYSVEIPANFATLNDPNDPDSGYSFVLDLYSFISVSFTFEPTTTTNTQATIIYNTGILKILGNYDTQRYYSSFFGNGLTIGYNSLNYFGTYFLNNRMTFDFLSNGAGMAFDNGNIYNYLFGNKIKSYIPILLGMFKKNIHYWNGSSGDGFGERYYFYFLGTSIISNGYYSLSYSSYNGWNFPYREQGEYHYKHTRPDTNENGDDNEVVLDDVIVTYSLMHDIYMYRYGTGRYTLCFGKKWKDLLGTGFCNEFNLLINCNGRYSNDEENHAGDNNWAGTCFVTIPVIDSSTYTYPQLHLIRNNTSLENMPLVTTSPANSSGQAISYGNICFFTSDDSSLNDGEFYINISYCPNTSN